MRPSEWVVSASADNATATATKAASSNNSRHSINYVTASFTDASISKLLQITGTQGGVAVTIEHYVHGADVIPIEFRGDVDTAVAAVLAASGTGGKLGKVNIFGFSGD